MVLPRFHSHAVLAAALLAALLLAPTAEAKINDGTEVYNPFLGGDNGVGDAPPVPGCTTYFYSQRVDHFNRRDTRRFEQRYTLCDAYWNRGAKEPIFMYLGNEAPLPGAWPTIFSDMARDEGGLLLYAEHRYYGVSLPLGAESLNNTGLKYLTVDQVLKDYATLVEAVRQRFGVPATAPAVCYGGSYGGNLAAYLRLKYPRQFDASLAASAVVKYLMPAEPFQRTKFLPYTPILNNALRKEGGRACADRVNLAYKTLQGRLSRTPAGRQQLATALHMCDPADITSGDDIDAVAYNIRDFWWGTFQVIFRSHPEINTAKLYCDVVNSYPATPLGAVEGMAAAAILGNWADTPGQCIPSEAAIMPFSNRDPRPDDPSMVAWLYQCCRQGLLVSTHTSSAPPSIYGKWAMPFPTFATWCRRVYGLRQPPTPPREFIYSDRLFARTTRLIFSNGELDPWAGGSVLRSLSRTVPAIVTSGASHRQDLSAVQPGNSAAFNATQTQIKAWIRQWVMQDHPGHH